MEDGFSRGVVALGFVDRALAGQEFDHPVRARSRGALLRVESVAQGQVGFGKLALAVVGLAERLPCLGLCEGVRIRGSFHNSDSAQNQIGSLPTPSLASAHRAEFHQPRSQADIGNAGGFQIADRGSV